MMGTTEWTVSKFDRERGTNRSGMKMDAGWVYFGRKRFLKFSDLRAWTYYFRTQKHKKSILNTTINN